MVGTGQRRTNCIFKGDIFQYLRQFFCLPDALLIDIHILLSLYFLLIIPVRLPMSYQINFHEFTSRFSPSAETPLSIFLRCLFFLYSSS